MTPRIQTLQREMSVLSTSGPTARMKVDPERTDTMLCALETQVTALRRQLAGFSSRLHENRKRPKRLQDIRNHCCMAAVFVNTCIVSKAGRVWRIQLDRSVIAYAQKMGYAASRT